MSTSKHDILSGHAPTLARGRSAIAAGPAQPPQLRRGRLRTWRISSAARHEDGFDDRPRDLRPQAEPSAKDRSPGFGFALALVLSTVVWLMFLAGLATLLVRAIIG